MELASPSSVKRRPGDGRGMLRYPMSNAANVPSLSPLVVRLRPVLTLSDDDFFELCRENRDLRLERGPHGEVLIMPPVGAETGRRGMRLAGQLDTWTERDGSGVAFDSSAGFAFPDGAIRSPDAAWVSRQRYEAVPESVRERFAPIVPDFVVELRSPSDRLADLELKLEEYRRAGVRLGWLIDPVERRVFVYRPDAEVEVLEQPPNVSAEPVLPGFVLDLTPIW
jgi:Uma2 family endonuclease